MIAGYKFGSCLSTFANCSDRYCKEGYGEGAGSLKEMLEAARELDFERAAVLRDELEELEKEKKK